MKRVASIAHPAATRSVDSGIEGQTQVLAQWVVVKDGGGMCMHILPSVKFRSQILLGSRFKNGFINMCHGVCVYTPCS